MQYHDGEIIISPKEIHWFCMPASIGEEEKINFLKIDFFLINEARKIEEINNLLKHRGEQSVFIFNLDKLFIMNNIQEHDYLEAAQKLANMIIANNASRVSIVHTIMIDPKLESIFKKREIAYLEKSYEGRRASIMEDFPGLINNMFTKDGKPIRAFLRINLYPKTIYKAEIKFANQETRPIQCLLKDISMNGLALMFQSKDDLSLFNLRNEVKVQVFIPGIIIKINLAIITRKDEEKFELAINYNIKDEKMITEESASYMMKMIYKWLKDVVDKSVVAPPVPTLE